VKYIISIFFLTATSALAQYNPGLPIPGLPKSVGQKTMAGSTSVVISSDQTSIPISGSITSLNASITQNGTAIPSYSTQIGYEDGNGLLQPIKGGINGIYVDGSKVQQGVTGTVTANQGISTSMSGAWPVVPTDGTHQQSYTALNEAKVSITQPLPAGSNLIGAINQSQVGGSAISLGQKTMANSYPVTIASDQVAPKTYENANATLSQSLIVGSGAAVTFTAPANAVGFLAMAPSSNAQNVRCASGTVATTSLGLRLEPGRDTGFIPSGANVSCIAESGTNQEVDVQWVQQ